MQRDPRVLLTDIDQAGADIQAFIESMSSSAYTADARTQAAVEREFEIIGEAINRLHADHHDLAHRIPAMRRIIDSRNFLAHGYDHVLGPVRTLLLLPAFGHALRDPPRRPS